MTNVSRLTGTRFQRLPSAAPPPSVPGITMTTQVLTSGSNIIGPGPRSSLGQFAGMIVVTKPPSPTSPPVITGFEGGDHHPPFNPDAPLDPSFFGNLAWLTWPLDDGDDDDDDGIPIRANDSGTPVGQRFAMDGVLTRGQPAQFFYLDDGTGNGTKAWFPASGMATGAGSTEHLTGTAVAPIAMTPGIDTSFLKNTGADESIQSYTLANGTVDGQIHNVVNESTSNVKVVSVTPANLHGGTTLTSSTSSASAALIWNAVGGEWHILGTALAFSLS